MFLLFGGDFDLDHIRDTIASLEKESAAPEFWNDSSRAEEHLVRLSKLKDRFLPWQALREECETVELYLTLAKEEQDEQALEEVRNLYKKAEVFYQRLRFQTLLTGPYDNANAYVQIHSGAGGLDASDWAGLVLRMYLKWAELHGYTCNMLEYTEDEGGVKSATILIQGSYVFGYMQSEVGIHRLVRISPFDKGNRRHTSFASVHVSPELEENIDVEIRSEDIRIDTYRASGAGGQHVNKTDSAVRITHLETGIVAQCQNERSQVKNKSMAMKILKSRLYNHMQEQQQEERLKHSSEKQQIAWGHQIRSYVFHPYTMVKDHRTGHQIGNPQTCLDGHIDEFIQEYLNQKGGTEKVECV